MAKSTKLVITALAGTIIRGKYTLDIRLALPTRLLLASLSALLKKCQGNMATKTINAYGAEEGDSNLATLLKTTVKTIVVSIGRTIAHAAPITVCLYRTLISRQESI